MIAKGFSVGAFGVAFLALLLTSGCGTESVKTATDPGVDFKDYHTFNFKEPVQGYDTAHISQTNRTLIQNAIRQELNTRGFTPAAEPDLWVNWYLSVEQKVYDPKNPTEVGDSVGTTMKKYFGFMYGTDANMKNQQIIPYKEGTLVIALVDRRENRAVWEGVVTDVLDNYPPGEELNQRIRDAVAGAFKKFPSGK